MLDRKTVEVLKYIKKHPDITLSALYTQFGESAIDSAKKLTEEEFVKEYIARTVGIPELELYHYTITIDGNAFLESIL
ncbi:MAG: hypothetical protein K2K06_11500 [Oscillospiraceae bacterium]|nr:hypothetical protein [Oscillospiraceae bacterium]